MTVHDHFMIDIDQLEHLSMNSDSWFQAYSFYKDYKNTEINKVDKKILNYFDQINEALQTMEDNFVT